MTTTAVQSVHKSDVDTAYIDFKGMAYGKHELELVIDGKRGRSEFVVSDSTAKAYSLSKVNVGITLTFDDESDEEIIYEFWVLFVRAYIIIIWDIKEDCLEYVLFPFSLLLHVLHKETQQKS